MKIFALRYSQGRSQTKCDGGASQLQLTWPIANLNVIRSCCEIKLFTLYFFKTKMHCSLLMLEALATVLAA